MTERSANAAKAAPNTINKMAGQLRTQGIPTPMRPGAEDAFLLPSLVNGVRVPRALPVSMAASPRQRRAPPTTSGAGRGGVGQMLGVLCSRNALSDVHQPAKPRGKS